jgi:hypothetical protein
MSTIFWIALLLQGIWPYIPPAPTSAGPSGPISYDSYTDLGYAASGTLSASHTSSGTNLGALLFVWSDSGTTLSAITYGGVAMTLSTSHAVTVMYPGTLSIYTLTGFSAGAATVSVTCTGQIIATVVTVKGAAQGAGFVDAVAPYATGTVTAGSAGSGCDDGFGCAAMPITTVADKSLVFGLYGGSAAIYGAGGPSSNGTYVFQGMYTSYDIWMSTATVTPPGSFTLQGQGSLSATYDVVGLSLAP